MGLKILIIEDEAPLRSLLAKLLRGSGYDVFEAEDGDEGLVLALREHPVLIISDIIMPKKDGISFVSDLRKDAWGKSVKVIMLTNSDDVEHQAKAVQQGIDTYLLKWNWKLKDFIDLVKERIGS